MSLWLYITLCTISAHKIHRGKGQGAIGIMSVQISESLREFRVFKINLIKMLSTLFPCQVCKVDILKHQCQAVGRAH